MPKAESKAGKLIATVKAGGLVRQTRKTGQGRRASQADKKDRSRLLKDQGRSWRATIG